MGALRLTILGGGLEVGANALLLEMDGARLLLDAGLHPRRTGRASLPLDHEGDSPDALFITHAHLDHVGALPVLARRHPRARLYWTRSTEALGMRQLKATAVVMHREIEERKLGAEVLFDRESIDELAWKSTPAEAGEWTELEVGRRLAVRPFHTGHLLGGAGFLFEGPSGRVAYTGDVCCHPRELQPPLELPGLPVDILIIEGTYGASAAYRGADYEGEVERFAGDARRVLERGGSLLVPAFALGRTQEMLVLVRRLMGQGRLPKVPVYVSGLGQAMSEIHDQRRRDPYIRKLKWRMSRAARVFEVEHLESFDRFLRRPSLLILTSGMMTEGTMSALAAERLVRDERHGVFFVGYVDPSELGHRVLSARPGDWVEFRRARPMTQVRTSDIGRYHFSAHADREEICALCEAWKPSRVIFVHGEAPALEWLAARVESPKRPVSLPATGDRLEL